MLHPRRQFGHVPASRLDSREKYGHLLRLQISPVHSGQDRGWGHACTLGRSWNIGPLLNPDFFRADVLAVSGYLRRLLSGVAEVNLNQGNSLRYRGPVDPRATV